MNWLLLAHVVLCITLLACIFARSVPSTDKVLVSIRLAFWLLWTATCLGLAAPIIWHYEPHPVEVLMLAGYTAVQLATSIHWEAGVPRAYLKARYKISRRASDAFGDFVHTFRE